MEPRSVRRRRVPMAAASAAFLALAHSAEGFCSGGAVGTYIASRRSVEADAHLAGQGRRLSRPPMRMMGSSIAPPRTRAEKKTETFTLSKSGMVEFGSSQRVEAPIPGASLESMRKYVADPARIVYACWEHDDITPMGDGVFRMNFRGQSFLSISIDMSVDIQLKEGADGNIQCKSVGYSVDDMAKILGQDFVDTFFLELEGELRVAETETKVRALILKNTLLSGDVGVTIGGKMPGLLAATPEQLVKTAALGINNRVLEYVSSTFVATVAGDYRQWAREQKQDAQ